MEKLLQEKQSQNLGMKGLTVTSIANKTQPSPEGVGRKVQLTLALTMIRAIKKKMIHRM